MKYSLKSLAIGSALTSLSVTAMAADPLVGTWQTFEDGQPKAQVQITQAGTNFTGKIIAGNTDKAKAYVGKTVITGLKADGGGKYSGGQITDPVKNKSYRLTAEMSGTNLALAGHLGPFSRTQNWKKIK